MENFSSLKIHSLFLVALLSISLTNAKNSQFELFGLNPCTNEVEKIKFYELRNGDVRIKPTDTTGICRIEDGDYELVWVMANFTLNEEYPYKVKITSSKKYGADTLRLEAISKCYEVIASNPWSGFCCCGEPCEGYQVDYYKNRNKRIEGNFNKGKPKGKIVYYQPDGKISYVEVYSRKGILKKTVSQ